MWGSLASFGGLCTRLDLQLTLRFKKPHEAFGLRSIGLDETVPLHRQQTRRPVGLRKDSRALWCGTVGRRTSDSFWRLYDKGVEKKRHAPGVEWRLELEAKGRLAQGLMRDLCAEPREPEWLYRRVSSSWEQAGFSLPLPGRRSVLPPVARPAAPPETSDTLRKHLSTSVRPIIQRALRTMSVEELLLLVGMHDVAGPLWPATAGLPIARRDPAAVPA
jgi:hypothetical protein